MGYYSEVRISMLKNDFLELKARAAMVLEYNFIEKLDELTIRGDAVVFGWNEIKWYQSFSEVRFIEDYLAELQEKGHPCSFIRIGEDVDDIQEQIFLGIRNEDFRCNLIHAVTTIEVY